MNNYLHKPDQKISTGKNSLYFFVLSMFLLSLMFSPELFAQAEPVSNMNESSNALMGNEFNSNYLQKVITALVVVVSLIFLLSIILKKLNVLNVLPAGSIKIISSMSLGGKNKLTLIEVGDEQILIGISTNGLSKIHTLSSNIKESEASPGSKTGENGFLNILTDVTSGKQQ